MRNQYCDSKYKYQQYELENTYSYSSQYSNSYSYSILQYTACFKVTLGLDGAFTSMYFTNVSFKQWFEGDPLFLRMDTFVSAYIVGMGDPLNVDL